MVSVSQRLRAQSRAVMDGTSSCSNCPTARQSSEKCVTVTVEEQDTGGGGGGDQPPSNGGGGDQTPTQPPSDGGDQGVVAGLSATQLLLGLGAVGAGAIAVRGRDGSTRSR